MTDLRMTSRLLAAGALAGALAATPGCSGGSPSRSGVDTSRAAGAGAASDASSAAEPLAHHPETFDAARALAARRNVPLLVDFYSPT